MSIAVDNDIDDDIGCDDCLPVTAPETESGEQTCSKCGVAMSWGSTSWCPACGFYPRLGTHVAVDRREPASIGSEATPGAATLPAWAGTVLAVGMFALLEVIGVGLVIKDHPYRPMVGAGHMLVGMACVLVIHLRAYFYAVMATDKVGLADLVVNPLSIWRPVVLALPRTSRMLYVACFGMIVAMGGVAMIGRDFQRVFEVGPRKRKKVVVVNPGAAVAKAARPDEDVEELEGAVTEFSGDADEGLDADRGPKPSLDDRTDRGRRPDSAGDPKKNVPEITARATRAEAAMSLTCTVIGYVPAADGRVDLLLLAANPEGIALRFIGELPVETIPETDRKMVEAYVRRSPTSSAAVTCPRDAFWVKPNLRFQIAFEKWDEEGAVVAPRWEGSMTTAAMTPAQAASGG